MSVDAPAPERSDVVLPTHEDALAAASTGLIGGPAGKRARIGAGGWWTPIRVLILFCVVMVFFGWAQKSPCRNGANWGHGYEFTHVCYSDVLALYGAEGISSGKVPYVDHAVEYPVGIGVAMEAVGDVVKVFPASSRAEHFVDLTTLLLGAAAVVCVVATALTNRRRPWDAAIIALSPALILHLGMNWDMLAAALLALAILAWSRERIVLAGVLTALATDTKFYPLLILIPLFFLCLRAARLRAWLTLAGTTIGVAVLVYLPFWFTSPAFSSDGSTVLAPSPWQVLKHGGGFGAMLKAFAPHHGGGLNGTARFFELNTMRPADWNSFWFALQNWRGKDLDTGGGTPKVLNTVTLVLFILLALAIGALILMAARRPRLGQVVFLTVLAFLFTSKVWSPQYVIWLVPLAALARPRWRMYLYWMFSEAIMLFVQFMFFVNQGDPRRGVTVEWFITSVMARDVILLIMAGLIVREILDPELDVVRADGSDDPAGGVLDGAPDSPFVRTAAALPAVVPA